MEKISWLEKAEKDAADDIADVVELQKEQREMIRTQSWYPCTVEDMKTR